MQFIGKNIIKFISPSSKCVVRVNINQKEDEFVLINDNNQKDEFVLIDNKDDINIKNNNYLLIIAVDNSRYNNINDIFDNKNYHYNFNNNFIC